MGQSASKEEVQQRRREVIGLFHGQKLLLLGGDGHGKSSLINTINHVIRLENQDAVYEEVAEMGTGGETKTQFLTRYRREDSMLFEGVRGSNFPVFLDTIGLSESNQNAVVKLVPLLATGKISEETNLRELLEDAKLDSFEVPQNADKELKAWSIIFVGSLEHQPVIELARSVGKANYEMAARNAGVRIFCVLTHADRSVDKSELSSIRKDYGAALRIPDLRILEMSTYTSDDVKKDGRTKPNLEKDLQVLDTFHRILRISETRKHILGK